MARSRKPSVPRVSPTRLNMYVGCPRQYYYAYVCRLPRRARSYFSFGSSLHGALEDFHKSGGTETQDVQTLVQGLETSWVDAGYGSPEEAAARLTEGQEILTTYYEKETVREAETLFLEKTLSWPLADCLLSGRIDRIDRRADGMLEVLDYKSGGYMPTVEDLEEDLAIGVYQLLVARNLESTPVMGTIYNLRVNESVSITRDEPALTDVQGQVETIFENLSTDTEFHPEPGARCRYCDFARYCPAAAR